MTIERLRNRGVESSAPTARAEARAPVARDFRELVSPPSATGATRNASPLSRFQAGEISASQYRTLKVHEATAHLGQLPPAQRAAIERMLLDHLETDPALSAMAAKLAR